MQKKLLRTATGTIIFLSLVMEAATQAVVVKDVADGDTVSLQTGEVVRLIGIDAPEAGQPGADISKDYLTLLIKSKNVKVEGTGKDKYGRLLAYVYYKDIFVNAEILRHGYAVVRYYGPKEPYWKKFKKIEKEAEKNKRGLWAFNVFQSSEKIQKATVVSWKDADKYYGEVKTVEGKIVDTYNSGKACFLNFHPDWRRHFSAVIFASDFYKFPDSPEDYYLYKNVRVKGLIKEYQGKPEIILKNKKQIEILKKD